MNLKGKILAAAVLGSMMFSCAEKQPVDNGSQSDGNVHGYVTDANGRPFEGVVVSNGKTSVRTDESGAYSLPLAGLFINCSIPSDCEIPYDSMGFPAFYKKVTNTSLPCNFVLTPLKGGLQKEWTLCAMADPQVHEADINRFASNIAPDLKQTLSSMSNVYSVILGDILWNSTSDVWANMKSQLAYAKTGAHFFTVPGNHDMYDSQEATNPNHSMYANNFGPENYSFNRGDVHVVCVNNIITEGKGQTEYKTGLSDEVYAWLQSDLALVDKSKAVCLCMHANVGNNSNVDTPHYSETLALLSEFAAAYVLTGHLHRSDRYEHSLMGGAISEYNIAAAFGNFWYTRTNLDGTPGGYNLITFKGTQMTGNLLKGAGHDSSYQIRCYAGSESFEGVFTNPYSWEYTKGTVVANVFNWNPDWKVELWQNGAKVCDMTHITSSDTRLVQRRTSEKDSFQQTTLGQNRDWWQWCQVGEPYDGRDARHPKRYKTDGKVFEGKVQGNNLGTCGHLFKGKLSVADGQFEVRATDPYGNTYTCSSFTSYTNGDDAWNWK